MESMAPIKKVRTLEILFRLTRIRFLPLIILPSAVGTALAYRFAGSFNIGYFLLVMLGVALLHLGANAIDDCYDYQNGVDKIANSVFPADFGGWKPLPRGLISLSKAKLVSALLFTGSLLISIYFALVIGYWSVFLAFSGILLAIFYTAPPLKLDYRGIGLGEIAILFAFGPIPVLGSYFVQTGSLSFPVFLVSLAVGLMTVTILIDHDMIFYEVYRKARKFSIGAVLGRKKALQSSLFLTVLAYCTIVGLVVIRVLPLLSLVGPIGSALILSRKSETYIRAKEDPGYYVPFTANALLSDWIFSLLLAITVVVPLH